MCGIDGIIGATEIDMRAFYAAHSRIAHRGPDDEGFIAGDAPDAVARYSGDRSVGRWREDPHVSTATGARWVLGFHRLSILDLSDAAHQPFLTPQGRWVLFNGEVYNFRELRSELVALSHKFHTSGDAEVVAHAWDQWGLDALERFNGMWSLAVYEPTARRLVLSRDRFGVKPLYVHLGANRLVFGSELKFLEPLVDLTIDEARAGEYLAEGRIDQYGSTLHPEAQQVDPGGYAVYDIDHHELRRGRFWTLHRDPPRQDLSLEGASAEFRELFESAIDLRMRSDVPVGSLLSGGLDSSAIVTDLHARGRFPDGRFRSFSAIYDEEDYSERRYVEAVAERAEGLEPTYVRVTPDRAAAQLGDVIRAQDAPFRSLAVYCQWLLYRTIREQSPVVVLLNGQGADESFGGYTRHLLSALGSHAMHGRLRELGGDAAWVRRNRPTPLKALLASAAVGLARRAGRGEEPGHGYRWGAPRSVTHEWASRPIELHAGLQHRDPFENDLRNNLLFSALPEYLRYEDRNSMAASLETRLPFLDYRLVEWAFRLPQRLKLRRGESKLIVRRATASHVPRAIRERTDKMGFTSPQEVWQRRVLAPWIRDGVDRVDLSLIDRNGLQRAYRRYEQDGTGDPFFWFRVACLGWWQELRGA